MATLTIADLDNGKRDLQTVSEVANSRAATATTRFGAQTTTLYEAIRRIGERGDSILRNLGFFPPVDYASGLSVETTNFTVNHEGVVYAAQPGAVPFTTGAWDAQQWYPLQNIYGDHNLLVFESFAEASAAAATLPDGQVVAVDGYLYNVQGGALTNKRPAAALTGFTGAGGSERNLQEKLSLELASAADWAGMDRSGGTSVSSALGNFISYACANGGRYRIPAGTYLMGTGIGTAVLNSVEFEVDVGAKFIAAPGFPATKMFLFTSDGRELKFKWHGGSFDCQNQPNSAAGQANDIFYVALDNADVDVRLDKTYSGQNWTVSGGDSHLFIAGCRSGRAVIDDCQGARDAGIYVSANQTATAGTDLYVNGNFRGCQTAAIAKRHFKRISLNGSVSDCGNGIGFGGAETASNEPLNGQSFLLNVTAQRTTTAAFIQASVAGVVNVVSTDIGCSIVAPSVVTALSLSGARTVIGNVAAHGVNPALTKNNNFTAVTTLQRELNGTIYQSTNNVLKIVASGIGRVIREQDSSDHNHFEAYWFDSVEPLLVGDSSTLLICDPVSGIQKMQAMGYEFGFPSGRALDLVQSEAGTNALVLQIQAGDAGGNILISPVGATNGSLSLRARGNGSIIFNPGNVKNYADDAAAAAGGIPIGGIYRTSNALKIRMV